MPVSLSGSRALLLGFIAAGLIFGARALRSRILRARASKRQRSNTRNSSTAAPLQPPPLSLGAPPPPPKPATLRAAAASTRLLPSQLGPPPSNLCLPFPSFLFLLTFLTTLPGCTSPPPPALSTSPHLRGRLSGLARVQDQHRCYHRCKCTAQAPACSC